MVLHTGDWKIDPDPLLGGLTDEDAIRRLGDEGVLAMVCDSTNVFVDGTAGSEADVRETLNRLIGSPARQDRRRLLRVQRRAHGFGHPRRRRRTVAAPAWSAAR